MKKQKQNKIGKWEKIIIIVAILWGVLGIIITLIEIIKYNNSLEPPTKDQEETSKRFTNTFQKPTNVEEANAYVFTNLYGNYSWSKILKEKIK